MSDSSVLRATRAVASVMANRDLRRVELAFFAFNAAEWATWIAIIVYAYERGGTTTAGIVALAQLVPAAVYAPVAARWADRHPPGRVLTLAYAVMAVTLAAAAAALSWGAPPIVVYVLGGLDILGLTLVRPCQTALTPSLARTPADLTAANVVSSWAESVSVLAAPAITGVLLDVSGPASVFWVSAAAATWGALLVAPLRRVPAPAADEGEGLAGGALQVLRRDPTARTLLLLLAVQSVAIGALDVLYPELAVGVLGRSEGWAGYLNAAFGLGGTLGIGVTALLVGRRRLAPPLAAGLAVWCVSFVLLAVAPGAVGALLLLAVGGAGRVVLDVAGRTLLQRAAPASLLAAVFGLLEGLTMAGLALGSILAPALVALGGADLALLGIAAVLPLGALLAGRRLLSLDATADVPVVEIGLLRSSPIFAPLGPTALEAVARALTRIDVPAGHVVIRQGDAGDRFYMVGDGLVAIDRDGTVVDRVRRGAGFGEVALLRDVPRTATCTAVEPTTLYALEKPDFLEAVTGHPAAHGAAERIAESLVPAI